MKASGLVADVRYTQSIPGASFRGRGAGDDIAWCQLGAWVEALHEAFAIGRLQMRLRRAGLQVIKKLLCG